MSTLNDGHTDSFSPGAIVIAKVANPLQRPGATGKFRPCTLIGPDPNCPGFVIIEGLTTLDHYSDGRPRMPVRDREIIGLGDRSFLWGATTRIPVTCVKRQISWATVGLAEDIIDIAGLSDALAIPLLVSAHLMEKKGVFGDKQ